MTARQTMHAVQCACMYSNKFSLTQPFFTLQLSSGRVAETNSDYTCTSNSQVYSYKCAAQNSNYTTVKIQSLLILICKKLCSIYRLTFLVYGYILEFTD